MLAEQAVLGDLATVPTRVGSVPAFRHHLRRRVVWLILRLGIRVRIPAESMRPTGQGTFDELRARWDERHDVLRRVVGELDTNGLQRHIFRHPVAGPLNTLQALGLLSAHLATHQRQLERLRAAHTTGACGVPPDVPCR
ncbi:DinB family protein [Gemmatimonas sp.]|uniref:DinB family protein n=1 Tax=Gemmatimonas sp. TaxID=1962908 RepID=UPI003340FF77